MITLCVIPNFKADTWLDYVYATGICLALDAMYILPLINS